MACTEAYKEHIEYTFNAFCRVVIRYAAINAWRDRDKRRQREISFEYLTEEKFYPFCTSDTYFIDPYKQYPVMICGQRVILTNGELAEALSSLPEKKREIIYLYFFGRYTQQEIGELYGTVWEMPVILGGLYGMRRSEILGLRWHNVDLENNTFDVSEQLPFKVPPKTKVIEEMAPPKSNGRKLPITELARPFFLKQLAMQEAQKEQAATDRKPSRRKQRKPSRKKQRARQRKKAAI